MTKRLMYLTGAVIVAVLGSNQPAQATTITFDQPITPGANAFVDSAPGFIDEYRPPNQFPSPAPNPDAFRTQGFTFGGYTIPVTPTRTAPELIIMLDASQCPANIGTTCAIDNSRYLVDDQPFSMFIGGGVNFSLTSFDASGLFPPEGCPQFIEGVQPGCDESGILFPALFIKVLGVNATNGVLATQISPLTSAFSPIALTNPAWANIAKAIFLPVDAQGVLAGRIMALDNINATAVQAVPEPASLFLLATGLAAAGARRRRRAAARPPACSSN
jgi:PEP-CTERM motif-containing protein